MRGSKWSMGGKCKLVSCIQGRKLRQFLSGVASRTLFSISYTKTTSKTSSQVTAFGKFCYSPLILNECFTNAKVAKLPFDKIEFLKQPCGSPMQQSPFKLTITKPSDGENMFHLSTNSRYIKPQDFMSLSPSKISPKFVSIEVAMT